MTACPWFSEPADDAADSPRVTVDLDVDGHQYPTPGAAFPMSDVRCPMPGCGLPVPGSRIPIPDSRFPVPRLLASQRDDSSDRPLLHA